MARRQQPHRNMGGSQHGRRARRANGRRGIRASCRAGKREGDTLVVDAIPFNDKTWLGPTGSLHSEDLHVTERYTRVDYNTINYDVTMVDPKVLTKPWVTHSTMMLREGTRLREYECAENN